ncbi:MAG: hypothetical protein OEX22_12445, partial [Cyclobacteriaceae bacterium]|nr:hypothetical protein [Cyclobacteriaceae bacterium]
MDTKKTSFIFSVVITVIAVSLLYFFRLIEKENIIYGALLIFAIFFVSLCFFIDTFVSSEIKEVDRILSESINNRIEHIEVNKKRLQLNGFKKLLSNLMKHLFRHQKKVG